MGFFREADKVAGDILQGMVNSIRSCITNFSLKLFGRILLHWIIIQRFPAWSYFHRTLTPSIDFCWRWLPNVASVGGTCKLCRQKLVPSRRCCLFYHFIESRWPNFRLRVNLIPCSCNAGRNMFYQFCILEYSKREKFLINMKKYFRYSFLQLAKLSFIQSSTNQSSYFVTWPWWEHLWFC